MSKNKIPLIDMFGRNVKTINYPVELKSDKEKELYNNAYIKEVKRLRIISMFTGHLAFYGIIIIDFGLLPL